MPNGTFFVELVAFAIIFWILAKYVIPPINRAMTARQDAIRSEFAELERGEGRRAGGRGGVQGADRRRPPRGGARSARRRASRARRSSPRCASRRRPRRARIVEHGHAQIAGRAPAGGRLAARRGRARWRPTLAGRIVGESLEDDDAAAAASSTGSSPTSRRWRRRADAAGRDAPMTADAARCLRRGARPSWSTAARSGRARDAAKRRATSCSAWPPLLRQEPRAAPGPHRRVGRRPTAKAGLAAGVFGGKVDDIATGWRRRPPRQRWTATRDLAGRRSSTSASRAWCGRPSDAGPRSATSCSRCERIARTSDPSSATRWPTRRASVADKQALLLESLLDGKALPATARARRAGRVRAATAPSTWRSRSYQRIAAARAGRAGRDRPHGRASSTDGERDRLGAGPRRGSTTATVHLNVVVDPERASAASGSRSVTTSSTAPSPAASTTPDAGSPADRPPTTRRTP